MELYEFRNDTCFLSVMLRNLTDYVIIPILAFTMLRNLTDCVRMLPFDFRHVTGLHGLCNNAFFFTSGMSRNFTDCLTMGAKYLEAVKKRLHAIKQWSLNEIRV